MHYRIKNENNIRRAEIFTSHGTVKTPLFMPDATYGTVHGLSMRDLEQIGVPAIVTTTLHIEQHLGSNFVSSVGGFHKLTGWNRPLLTDSGGFQVYSLIHARPHINNKITDAGCSFVDPRNGNYSFLSPEISQLIQHAIGADIRIVLDEPLMIDGSLKAIKTSVARTIDWAARSKAEFLRLHNLNTAEFDNPDIARPLLGAVIQGGSNFEYRRICAEALIEIGFDIYCLGGMPLRNKRSWDYSDNGGFHHELLHMLSEITPQDKLRYALGVGTPDDIFYCIKYGWDIFDTVLPTRNARHGYLYVDKGAGDVSYEHYDVLHIKNSRYAKDLTAISELHPDLVGVNKAFLRYLIKTKSRTGERLATLHNLAWYQRFVEGI